MNTVPSIGSARGVFEIFVPGVFLFLNIGISFYFLYVETGYLPIDPPAWVSSPVFGTVVVVSFGYLLGVILRVFRANMADKISALFLRAYTWGQWRKHGKPPVYLVEPFPFIESLDIRAHRDLPVEVGAFFDDIWSETKGGGRGQAFFNFCKTMVSSEESWAANEIYSAEALTRYIASIFYALVISLVCLVVVGIFRSIDCNRIVYLLLWPIGVYLFAIFAILRNLRFIRLKEVETVFAATFKNRECLLVSRER